MAELTPEELEAFKARAVRVVVIEAGALITDGGVYRADGFTPAAAH